MSKIKKFYEFVQGGGFVGSDYVEERMEKIRDLVSKSVVGEFVYKWSNTDDHHVVLDFVWQNVAVKYDLDVDDLFVEKTFGGKVDFKKKVDSLEDAMELIESDLKVIMPEGVEERVKSQRYKGHKIPGKYLTKNPGKMKKEIDTFRGKKTYKKDWDADYTSGKGGEGKRVKTKKSAATKAYQRMFGDKEK